MHKFKELDVYTKALRYTKAVRQTTKKFPRDEIYGLASQSQRAADSIVLNIAEGAGNSSKKEFSKFLGYSIRSGFECLGCSDISLENDFVDTSTYTELTFKVNEIIAMLYGLQKSLLRS